MWKIARETEDALWAAAKAQLGESAVRHKALVPAIERRSSLYTEHREELGSAVASDKARDSASSKADLAARALFFTPADAAKVKVPVAELVNREALDVTRPLRVLDVGAGCGAMTLGLAEALADVPLEVLAIDRDAAALNLFSATVKQLGRPRLALETRVSSVAKIPRDERDVIVCGSVLNEINEAKTAKLARELLSSLASDGVLIIIEPALRLTSRRLHRLRDLIIGEALGNVFAPCTRTAAPCPALELERDWCHEDRAFAPTPRLAKLTNATGLRSQRLKFSYLVVTRAPIRLARDKGLLRVVSAVKKSKGQSELFACGDNGRDKLRLQKRDRTAANRAFEKARRGQLLQVGDGSYTLHDPAAR